MNTASVNFLLNIFDTNHTEDFRVLCKRKDRTSSLLTLWDDCWQVNMAWMICSGINVLQLTKHRSTLALNTYIHTYLHRYIYTYIRTYIHKCVRTYKPTYIHVRTYRDAYVHKYIHTSTYMHAYLHTYMHTYTHTYVHTYIYTDTYMHTHTHTYTNLHAKNEKCPHNFERKPRKECPVVRYLFQAT